MYNILIEFGIPMKLVRLIKMCLIETYSRVRVGRHLSDTSLKNQYVIAQHHMKSVHGVSFVTNPQLKQRLE